LKNWRTLKTGLHGFLQNCARRKKGLSEAAACAPVQDEAVQAVLGMKPKHIQVGHFCFPLPLPRVRVFSALFSAPKFWSWSLMGVALKASYAAIYLERISQASSCVDDECQTWYTDQLKW
jgi:hypothetical protein